MDDINLSELIGANFRHFREKHDFSQEAIADKLDVATARVSEFETGKGNPTLETISDFANAIGIEVHDLFDFSGLHQSNDFHNKESLIKIHSNTLLKHNLKEVRYIIDSTNTFLKYLDKK